jgi:hypothetical protein
MMPFFLTMPMSRRIPTMATLRSMALGYGEKVSSR